MYEIAAELGVDSKVLMTLLKNLGYPVTGITSVLEESDSAEIIRKIGSLRRMSLDDEEFKDQTVPGEMPEKVSHCIRCGKKLGLFRKRFRCTMCGAITCKQCHSLSEYLMVCWPSPSEIIIVYYGKVIVDKRV